LLKPIRTPRATQHFAERRIRVNLGKAPEAMVYRIAVREEAAVA
jgi:hypothetical protein